MKRATVVFALPHRQWQWSLDLPACSTVAEALAAAAAEAPAPEAGIDWEHSAVGIHGAPVQRSHVYAQDDRIEIYRPLADDPRARRRRRVEQSRRGAAR